MTFDIICTMSTANRKVGPELSNGEDMRLMQKLMHVLAPELMTGHQDPLSKRWLARMTLTQLLTETACLCEQPSSVHSHHGKRRK